VHKKIISAVERAESVRDKMLYVILRGSWFDTVLNVHAPTENKTDDMKGSICHGLDCVWSESASEIYRPSDRCLSAK
jgi:hypothetical protein